MIAIKKKKVITAVVFFLAVTTIVCVLCFLVIRFQHRHNKDSPAVSVSTAATVFPEEGSTENMISNIISDADYHFENIGYIYYVLPEEEDEFKENVADYLQEHHIDTENVLALSYCEDDKYSEEGTALFYMQLDQGKILQMDYDKQKESYTFAVSEKEISNIEDYGGTTEIKTEEIDRSREAEAGQEGMDVIDYGTPEICDLDEELTAATDLTELKEKLRSFLEENQETRRNIYVSSFESRSNGYEAVLRFENPRPDKKDVKVQYDSTKKMYQFSWEEED